MHICRRRCSSEPDNEDEIVENVIENIVKLNTRLLFVKTAR